MASRRTMDGNQDPLAAVDVMSQLADRLPLCLIMDLVMPQGPHSAELLAAENPAGRQP